MIVLVNHCHLHRNAIVLLDEFFFRYEKAISSVSTWYIFAGFVCPKKVEDFFIDFFIDFFHKANSKANSRNCLFLYVYIFQKGDVGIRDGYHYTTRCSPNKRDRPHVQRWTVPVNLPYLTNEPGGDRDSYGESFDKYVLKLKKM